MRVWFAGARCGWDAHTRLLCSNNGGAGSADVMPSPFSSRDDKPFALYRSLATLWCDSALRHGRWPLATPPCLTALTFRLFAVSYNSAAQQPSPGLSYSMWFGIPVVLAAAYGIPSFCHWPSPDAGTTASRQPVAQRRWPCAAQACRVPYTLSCRRRLTFERYCARRWAPCNARGCWRDGAALTIKQNNCRWRRLGGGASKRVDAA